MKTIQAFFKASIELGHKGLLAKAQATNNDKHTGGVMPVIWAHQSTKKCDPINGAPKFIKAGAASVAKITYAGKSDNPMPRTYANPKMISVAKTNDPPESWIIIFEILNPIPGR